MCMSIAQLLARTKSWAPSKFLGQAARGPGCGGTSFNQRGSETRPRAAAWTEMMLGKKAGPETACHEFLRSCPVQKSQAFVTSHCWSCASGGNAPRDGAGEVEKMGDCQSRSETTGPPTAFLTPCCQSCVPSVSVDQSSGC